MHIIILDEDQVPLQLAELAEVNYALNVAFALVVARMGLACKNKLNRLLAIRNQLHHVFELFENKRRPLVGRKSAGEPNRQRIGIQQGIKHDVITLSQPLPLDEQAATRK